MVYAEKEKLPFVYKRGGMVMAVNLSLHEQSVSLEELPLGQEVYTIGHSSVKDGILTLSPQTFVMYKAMNKKIWRNDICR